MFKFSGFYRLSRDGFQHAGAMIFWRFRHREVRGEAFFHSIPNFLRRVAESLAASKQLGTGQHRKWIAAHNRSFSLWTLHTCTCLHVLYVYIYMHAAQLLLFQLRHLRSQRETLWPSSGHWPPSGQRISASSRDLSPEICFSSGFL